MRKPKKKAPPKPRNVAAKALGSGRFKPKVEPNPKAYKRRQRHKIDPTVPRDDDPPPET
jgi:hypothetical protein